MILHMGYSLLWNLHMKKNSSQSFAWGIALLENLHINAYMLNKNPAYKRMWVRETWGYNEGAVTSINIII